MRKTIFSLFVLFAALLCRAQNLSFDKLAGLSFRDTASAVRVLERANWKVSNTSSPESLIYIKDAVSGKEQVILLPQNGYYTTVRYRLRGEDRFTDLHAQALALDYTDAFREENEREAVQYLLKENQVLVGFHKLKEASSAGINYTISVSSFDAWLLNQLAPTANKIWRRRDRADFMKGCFTNAFKTNPAASVTKVKTACGRILQSLEVKYPDTGKLNSGVPQAIMEELTKKCLQ